MSVLDDFREAMRAVVATVFVVTLTDEGRSRRYGITATSVSSLSFEPLSLLACINKSSSIHAPLLLAERFCINVLAEEQAEIAAQFGSSSREAQRFTTGTWDDLQGTPALVGAQSNIVCSRGPLFEEGTHTIFVGRVLEVRNTPGALPLMYRNGGYLQFSSQS